MAHPIKHLCQRNYDWHVSCLLEVQSGSACSQFMFESMAVQTIKSFQRKWHVKFGNHTVHSLGHRWHTWVRRPCWWSDQYCSDLFLRVHRAVFGECSDFGIARSCSYLTRLQRVSGRKPTFQQTLIQQTLIQQTFKRMLVIRRELLIEFQGPSF